MATAIRVSTGHKPRAQQVELHRAKARFKVLVAHRRFGKTVFCINELIHRARRCALPAPRYAYLAPTQVQAKDVAWSYLKQYTAPIPGVQVNETELWVELPPRAAGEGEEGKPGARIRLYGAEHADRLRGLYFDGVVLDEYAYMSPRVWAEVIRPALADRRGWAIFIGTPLGRNGFADLYEGATLGFAQDDGTRRADPDWAGFLYKASETGIVPEAELDAARRIMSPDQYAQEFECSFDAAVPGAYYATLIAQAEREGRIKPFPHEPALPVHTGWDLGIGDPTAIWFAQIVLGEIRLIDYVENAGVGLEHYVAQLRAGHRADWVYGMHFFPHDLAVKELGSGMARADVLRNYGLAPTILAQSSVDDGIAQVRFALRKCWFNATRCAEGVKALRQYRSDWDEKRQVLKPVPLHDWTSHGADAFRYLCIGLGRYLLDRQPLADPALSAVTRAAPGRARFADGSGKGRPYGW
jgi:hypothetical protein